MLLTAPCLLALLLPSAAPCQDQTPAPPKPLPTAQEPEPPIFSEADYDAKSFRAVPRDGFPVANMPSMSTANEGDQALGMSELVIGLVEDGEARAYPLRVMGGIELANDVCGETPIAVSW